jgi:hypothetical protein
MLTHGTVLPLARLMVQHWNARKAASPCASPKLRNPRWRVASLRAESEKVVLLELEEALLDRLLTLLDLGDLAHLRELSKAWQRRIAALPRFVAAHVLAVFALPDIVQHLADGEDAYAQLAKARLVSKAWFDAVSDASIVGRMYRERDAVAQASAVLRAAPGQSAEYAPRARMSWLQ